MTGEKLIEIAEQHLGEKYVLGSIAPKNDPTYSGPWDCAELTTFCVFQASGKLYGCARNDGDPEGADAYTGFYGRDVEALGIKIPVEQAIRTKGAFLLRLAGKGLIGHIVISDGKGGTVEAHSTKTGVIRSTTSGRRWDCGVLIPWIEYKEGKVDPPQKKPARIYRLTSPTLKGEDVKTIQRALKMKNVDGIFGRETFNAVRAYQLEKGLVADGEVGPLTAAALGIRI